MTLPVETPPEAPVTVTQLLDENKPIKTRKKREPKHDFKDGFGRVPARRHVNGKGWVANTAVVEDSVYIGPHARVFNSAYVVGNVRLEGKASVSGGATVSNKLQTPLVIKQHGHVYGQAVVRDAVLISGQARVCGSAHISGLSRLFDNVVVSDCAQIIASSLIGTAAVSGHALIIRSTCSGATTIAGNSTVINSTVSGHVEISDFAQVLGATQLQNSNMQHKTRILNYAILADNTEIWAPVVVKNHAVAVRCRFSFSSFGEDFQPPEINGNLVLHQVRPNSLDQLNRTLADLRNPAQAQAGSRNNPAGIAPVASFPVRHVNHLEAATRPRRVQRLQEAAV